MGLFVKAADCDAFEQMIVETLESRSVRILGYFKCDQRSGQLVGCSSAAPTAAAFAAQGSAPDRCHRHRL